MPFLPADPQVPAGEKTSDGVPGEVVNPALLPQLSHDGVDEGESGSRLGGEGGGELDTQNDGVSFTNSVTASLHKARTAVRTRYLSPRSQVLCVVVPVHLSAHRVALHLVEVGDTKTGCVEELPPEQLAVERYRGV